MMRSSIVSNAWKVLPLFLFVMLFCSGCWDKKEFNQLAIAQTIAIDYKEEANESPYVLTVQLVMPAASDEEISGDSMWLISGEGASVAEALEQISRSAPRELYLDHLDIVLLGEGLLQHDMGEGIEYLMKEDVLRRRTNLLAVQGHAGDLLEAKLKLADVDIYYLRNLLRDQRQWVQGADAIINDYYLAVGNGLKEGLLIPRIELKDDKALYLSGAALIQTDGQSNRLLRWVKQDTLDSYRWITGGAEIYTLPASNEHGSLTVELRKNRCKWELVSEEPLQVRANLQGQMLITENQVQRQMHDNERTMKEQQDFYTDIQKEMDQRLTKQVQNDFAKLQSAGCDALGLGRWLYARYPDLVEADHWAEQFSALTIDIQIETHVRSDA